MNIKTLNDLLDIMRKQFNFLEAQVQALQIHIEDQSIEIQNLYRRSEGWPIENWTDTEDLDGSNAEN